MGTVKNSDLSKKLRLEEWTDAELEAGIKTCDDTRRSLEMTDGQAYFSLEQKEERQYWQNRRSAIVKEQKRRKEG
jgi:hypothetical protein